MIFCTNLSINGKPQGGLSSQSGWAHQSVRVCSLVCRNKFKNDNTVLDDIIVQCSYFVDRNGGPPLRSGAMGRTLADRTVTMTTYFLGAFVVNQHPAGRGASDMYHISIGILLFFIGKIEFFYRSNIISRLKSVFSVHFSFVWTTNQPPKKVFFVRELPKYTWERKREKIDCIVFFVFDIILKTIKQLIKNMNLHNFAIV